jgi:peptide deformylase
MSDTRNEARTADIPSLRIIRYPDPRLKRPCTLLRQIDEATGRLVEKMFQLMFDSHGVGLAASQVGLKPRLFVASPTADPADRRVYINPQIIAIEGKQQDEEGCLSLPGITCRIRRADVVTIRATNLDGEVFTETGQGLLARVFQHELDHLDGRLLIDRMGALARLARRQALRELEQQFIETRA